MDKWKTRRSLLRAQSNVVAARGHLDVAIEMADKENIMPEIIGVMSRVLVSLDGFLDDFCHVRAQLWTPPKEKGS